MSHSETFLSKINTICNEVDLALESLDAKGKKPLKHLAAEISNKYSYPEDYVYDVIRFYTRDYPGFKVVPGKHGGVMRDFKLPVTETASSLSTEAQDNV